MSLDWDARTYDRVANPHEEWARTIIRRLDLRGDEVVMDAGCGSGRQTRILLDSLPAGRVYGVDLSPAMLALAGEQLAAYGERVRLIAGDLRTVDLPEPVEIIFSNATFHWIPEHERLFANLFRLLRPGGRLVAQCGGAGNIARYTERTYAAAQREPFRPYVGDWREWRRYATPEETVHLLEQAGFVEAAADLVSAPAPFSSRREFEDFGRSVILGPLLEQLPEELREAFPAALVDEFERAGDPYLVDYVRLNLRGRRAG